MKIKSREIPGIMFTSLLLLLFLVWLGSSSNLKSCLENLIPLLGFNQQKALASENGIEEALDIIHLLEDTMYVESDSAFRDSVIWISIGMENDLKVAGFAFAITYDTSILAPDYVPKIDTNVVVDSSVTPWDTTVVIDTVFLIIDRRTERSDTLHWYVWSGGLYGNHLDTLRFIGGIFPDTLNPILDVGRGSVVEIKFKVNPYAEEGEEGDVSFVQWLSETEIPNTWDDSLFDNIYVPRTKTGIFTVRSGEGPVNNCPTFASMPLQRDVNEGTTLQFNVTATDLDGDTVRLYMDPIDPDPGYNYTFRETSAVASVSQSFSFSPIFGQGGVTLSVTFRAEDEHGCVADITVLIDIIETAQDLLIASSEEGGIPGCSERMVPFVITNSVPIYGFQFTLRWDGNVVDVDSFARPEITSDFSLWTNLGDSSGVATVLVFSLTSQTIPAGIETVLYAAFSVDENAPPGEVTLQLENAVEAVNPGDPSYPLGMVHGKFTVDMFGDANIDRRLDIADVVSVVAHILGNIDFTYREFLAADVVPNDTINVADLVGIINIILGWWSGPSPSPYSDSEPMAIVSLDYEDLRPGTAGQIEVLADLEVPVAGAQIKIAYDPEQLSFEPPRLSDWSDRFIAEYKDDKQGELIVLLYNMSNDPISPGEGSILSLPVTVSPDAVNKIKVEIDEVVLADENAVQIPVDHGKTSVPKAFELTQNYPNPFNPTTTIKYTLPSVGDGKGTLPTTLKIYNVLGEVVRTLVNGPKSPGVYYEVWDGSNDQGNQVASGIYFYRLTAGEFNETKKMVLLK